MKKGRVAGKMGQLIELYQQETEKIKTQKSVSGANHQRKTSTGIQEEPNGPFKSY